MIFSQVNQIKAKHRKFYVLPHLNICMNFELRLIPRLEQVVYLIPEYEVAQLLEKASPFHSSFPTKDDMLAYLTHVNGALKERTQKRAALYEQYVTAAAIYACVRPIVHLHLPEKLPTHFTTIAERKPYRLPTPLEIVLTKTEESTEPHIIESFLNAQLVDIEEHMPRDASAIFTASEFIRNKLALGLNSIANRLQRTYSEQDHLLFTGIKDICFPLFRMGQRGKEYHTLSVYLQQHYGHLHLKVPLCLAPERKEAA